MKYAILLKEASWDDVCNYSRKEYLLNSIGQTYYKPSLYQLKTVRQILMDTKFKQIYPNITKTIVPIKR